MGARTWVQDGTVVHVYGEEPTAIGSDCVVGHNAHLEGCTIGDRCLVGSGSVVLNFATIGPDSIIEAGAVVMERVDVPAGSLATGVPARIRPVSAAAADGIRLGVDDYLHNSVRYREQL